MGRSEKFIEDWIKGFFFFIIDIVSNIFEAPLHM